MGTIQVKDDGSFDQDLNSGDDEKSLDPRYSMKPEPAALLLGWVGGGRGAEGIRNEV